MNRRINFLFYVMILSILLTCSGTGFAEEVEKLKPLEVEATRSTLSEENIPSSVTVITREKIERSQHLQVQDLLRETLGADVVSSGPMGASTSVFLRGAGSSSTLVMIDGVQVNSNTTGTFNFADLTLDNIERIEILRGPQSTLWGADAVGGVINIITKKGKGKPSHFVSFEGGSFATFKETVGSSGAIKKFDYSITATRIDSEGFSSANERNGNTEDDGYENTTVSTRMGYNFLDDGRVEFIGRYTKKIIDFDAFEFGTGPVDGPNFSKGDSYYLATPLQKSITDWWDAKITPSYSHEKLFTFDPSFENSHITNRTYTIDVQNNLDLGEYFSATFGGEYQVLNGVNNESDLRKTIYEQGYYLQTQFNHEDRIILTAGFRQDINSKFEDKLTYKFEGAYRFKEYGTRLRAAAATGFRAPTLNDLFFPGFSNPNLKPEESESWEVGFDQKFFDDRVEIGTTYFDSDLTNLIQFDFATSMPENVGKATSKGLENYLKVAVTKSLDVSLNYTWNQAEDDDGVPLRRRAKHKFTATAYHTWNKLNSLVSVIYKSDIRDGVGVGADGFTRVRAALSYRVLDNLTVTARGENLFDEDYEEIPGFGTADVSGYAGFVFTF